MAVLVGDGAGTGMYAGTDVGGGMPGAWRGEAGHRAQMVSNVIAARTTPAIQWPDRGVIATARRVRHEARPGAQRACEKSRPGGIQPRLPDARMPLAKISTTCCLLQRDGTVGRVGATVRRACRMAAAIPNWKVSTTVLPLATAFETPASVGRKRQALSTPSPGEPACGRLAGTYP